MADLNSDTWIRDNSPIGAERLHAIGVVAYRWNECERWLFYMFEMVLGAQTKEAWVLAHDLGDCAISNRILELIRHRPYSEDAVVLIKNALAVYDRCRQNRNSLVHSWTSGPESEAGLLAKKSRRVDEPDPVEFPSDTQAIRIVAEQIRSLQIRMWILCCYIDDQSIQKPITSTKTLSLPEILCSPPLPNQTKQPPQRKSFPA